MKTLLAITAAAALGLGGCCTRQTADDFSRLSGEADRPSGLCGIFSGWGTTREPERLSAAYSPVAVNEYGELLCGHLELEDYASCVNRIWHHYREANRRGTEPGESTSGPLAAIVRGGPRGREEILLGSYWSDLFSGGFRVSNETLSCNGYYSALAGDTEAVFDVTCDNGRRGRANLVRDRSGANGIGRVYMDDGTVGKIVFGHATVGGALGEQGG